MMSKSWERPSRSTLVGMRAMWYQDLTDEQQDAVDSDENRCVIAGPGTGKTRVLLAKLLHSIERGAVPSEIRVVNFTNAGVRDLRSRLDMLDLEPGIPTTSVTTFHSLAISALMKSGSQRITRPVYIVDDWEEENLIDSYMNHALDMHHVGKARKARRDFDARWCIASDDPAEWFGEGSRRQFEHAYRTVRDLLGFTTRGELTFQWWQHLRGGGESGVRCSHLLVDEYQDLNECEHDILHMLTRDGASIFAVGDPNQAIYETLRHAHPTYCSEFPERMNPGDKRILTESFRCPAAVLRMGQQLLGNAEGVPNPDATESQGFARILRFPSGNAELAGVVALASQLLRRRSGSRVLIGVPSHAFGTDLIREFARSGPNVPLDIRTREARGEDELACRRGQALLRLAREPEIGIPAATAITLECAKTTRRKRIVELIELAASRSVTVGQLFESAYIPEGPLGGAIERARRDVAGLRESDDAVQLASDITGCDDLGQDADNEQTSNNDEAQRVQPGTVAIMTIHSSKGLEADWSIIPAVEPGYYERDLVGAKKEERRRLLYVGITRSLRGTFLTFAARRTGMQRYSDPRGPSSTKGQSTFIDDILDASGSSPDSGTDVIAKLAQ